EKKIVRAYNSRVSEYNMHLREAKKKYVNERATFLASQKDRNDAVLALRTQYERGVAAGIETYMGMILQQSSYPDNFSGDPQFQFDESSRILVVNFWLPGLSEMPNIYEYKFVQSRKAIEPKEMKQKDFEAFYEDAIHQIALRTIREIFMADYRLNVQAVVFNG